MFYFQRPDDPGTFFSENISGYGDWCKPKDQIYKPQARESRFYYRTKYEDTKREIKALDFKISNLQRDIKELEKDKNWYRFVREKQLTRLEKNRASIKDPVKYKNWSDFEYNTRNKKANRRIRRRQKKIENYKKQEKEKMQEIEYYSEQSEYARKIELWKKEIKTFYGLE